MTKNKVTKSELHELRPLLANTAQSVLDSWEQNEEGFDSTFGRGGVCDEIAHQMALIVSKLDNIVVLAGDRPGDGHAWLLAVFQNDNQAFAVDIPARAYEVQEQGFWTKLEEVIIAPTDVIIKAVPYKSILEKLRRYQYDMGQICWEEYNV